MKRQRSATARLALIGCGSVARKHAQAISGVAGLCLTAVYDPDMDRAQALAPVGVPARTVLRDVFEDPDVDAVVITAPSFTHVELTRDALRAGKDAIVEKPLALNGDDVRELRNTAAACGRSIFVVQQRRLDPHLTLLRQAFRSGAFGRVGCVGCEVLWYRPPSYFTEAPWRGRREEAGGVLLNQGLHALDLLLWIMGAPVSVFAMHGRHAETIDTAENIAAVVEFPGGSPGTIRASVTAYPRNLVESLSIVGDRGSVIIGGPNLNRILTWEFVDGPPEPEEVTIVGHLGFYELLAEELVSRGDERTSSAGGAGRFCSAPRLPSASDVQLTIEVACAIQESALNGRRVWISDSNGGRAVGSPA